MVFWIAAAGMAIAVAVLMALALLRGRAEGAPAEGHDLRVYRDQLREVDKDLARGVIGAEDAERLRTEISRRILDADRARARSGARTGPDTPRTATMVAVALLLVASVGAFWTYTRLGAPGYPDLPLAARITAAEEMRGNRPVQAQAEAAAAPAPETAPDPQYAALMEQLRAAVAERPDDLPGHELLARNEAGLGNFAAAHQAHARVLALKGDAATADDFAAQADLMIRAAGGYVSPEAERALTEALRRDPTHGPSRYLSGLMFAQLGRPDLAFRLWRPLLEESSEDDPWTAPLREQIEEIAWRAGENYTPPPASLTRGPDLADMEAVAALPPEEREVMVRGMVERLSDRLATQGGSAQDWARLIRAYGVLGDRTSASAVWTEGQVHFANRPSEMALLQEAAEEAGVAGDGLTEGTE